MRLVTTKLTEDGRSMFAANEEPHRLVASGFPDVATTPLSACDEPPDVRGGSARRAVAGFFPPRGGHRFFLLTIHPHRPERAAPAVEELAEFNRLFPGLLAAHEADGSGMHTSDTVDLGVVLSGRVVLELDDGASRVLETGDAFVQNGTRHRWQNPGPVPATLVVVMLGASCRG